MQVHEPGGPRWSFTVHGPRNSTGRHYRLSQEDTALLRLSSRFDSVRTKSTLSIGRAQHWSKIHVVHCGLQAVFFSREMQPVPAAKRLVCIGRLCEQKGAPHYYEAARRLAADDIDFESVLVGDGEMRPELTRLSRSTNYRKRFVSQVGLTVERSKSSCFWLARWYCQVLPKAFRSLSWRRWRLVVRSSAHLSRVSRSWLPMASMVGWSRRGYRSAGFGNSECLDASSEQLSSMGPNARQQASCRHNINIETRKLAALFDGAISKERTSDFSDSELSTTSIC